MARLISTIQQSTRTKGIEAVVVDVMGKRCSVALSRNGRRLVGISFSGLAPKIGENVLVDFKTGNAPIAITNIHAINAQPASITSLLTLSSHAASTPVEEDGGSPTWITEVLSGTIDGVNMVFATSVPYQSGIQVFINGLRQVKDSGYSESGESEITFSEPPKNIGYDDVLEVTYLQL